MKRIIRRILDRTPYIGRLREQVRETGFYPAGHYYSPIPSRDEVATGLRQTRPSPSLPDVDLRRTEQLRLLESMARFYKDIPFPDQKSASCRYYFDQGWYSYSDAIMLYSMIRHFGIHRAIEVGSGFSSAVMLDTLEKFGPSNFDLTFIEPFPDRLRSLIAVDNSPNVKLIEKKIQDVDLGSFKSLQAGDLLLVDSSHVMKFRSDLHIILFDILPLLPRGVFVHFHDVFYPFEYPDEWLRNGRYWNECYTLRAFLSGNSQWEVVLFTHYANLEFAEFLSREMPLCRKNFGGSLYLRKVG